MTFPRIARNRATSVVLRLQNQGSASEVRMIRNIRAKTVLAAFAVLLIAPFAPSHAQQISPAGVASYFVGRAYLDPATGQGQVAGYFTDIKGISGALFSGSSSEATAFFTFRSDVFSITPLPTNGDLALALVSPGTFSVYLNANPHGDWSNPDSFSNGQLVAKFARGESLFLQAGAIGQHVLTEVLVSSQDFTFQGHEYNFRDLSPGGITLYEFISNTPIPGVTGFPVALVFGGHAVALQKED